MMEIFTQLLNKLGFEVFKDVINSESDFCKFSYYHNKALSRDMAFTSTTSEELKKVKEDDIPYEFFASPKELSNQYYSMSTDKNFHSLLFLEVDNVFDSEFQKLVLETAVDTYSAQRSIILFNKEQKNLLEELIGLENVKEELQKVLNSDQYFTSLKKNKHSKEALLFDIVSKLVAMFDLLPLIKNAEFKLVNLEMNGVNLGKEETDVYMVTSERYSNVFDLLENKNKIYDYFYPNQSFSFQLKSPIKTFSYGYNNESRNSNHKIEEWVATKDICLATGESKQLERLFYVLSLRSLGVGLLVDYIDYQNVVGTPIVDLNKEFLLKNERLKVLDYIHRIAVSTVILNSPLIYLNMSNFPTTDNAVKLIEMLATLPRCLIFNQAIADNKMMYLRYKLSKAQRIVNML